MTQNNNIFFRDFDQESEAERLHQDAVMTHKTLTETELSDLIEEAKKAGFQEGFEKGSAEGVKKTEASSLAQQSQALSTIAHALPELADRHEQHMEILTQDTLGLMQDVLSKVFSDVVRANRMKIIQTEVNKSLSRAIKSSWIEIKVPHDLSESLSEHIESLTSSTGNELSIKILPDRNISTLAVNSRWESGNSEYDAERLCEKIIDTISSEVKE